MTKTEQRKSNTKAVIEMLINKYKAYNIEDEMGGRIMFFIDSKSNNTFQCEYHRTNQTICIYENRKLGGSGWGVEDIRIAAEAKQYEELLNREIEATIVQYIKI